MDTTRMAHASVGVRRNIRMQRTAHGRGKVGRGHRRWSALLHELRVGARNPGKTVEAGSEGCPRSSWCGTAYKRYRIPFSGDLQAATG